MKLLHDKKLLLLALWSDEELMTTVQETCSCLLRFVELFASVLGAVTHKLSASWSHNQLRTLHGLAPHLVCEWLQWLQPALN